jgi:hypothetical protein
VCVRADISLELFLIASKFGLDALRDLALDHLRRQLTAANAVDLLRRAVALKAEPVKKLCVAYVAQYYHAIDNMQELTQDPDGAKLLLEIMDQVRPHVVSECADAVRAQAQGRRRASSGTQPAAAPGDRRSVS